MIMGLSFSTRKKDINIDKKWRNPIKMLPDDIQSRIYDFLGPDEKSKETKDKINKLFKSEHIGIPYLEYSMTQYNSFCIKYIVPNFSYLERKIIQKESYNFCEDINYSKLNPAINIYYMWDTPFNVINMKNCLINSRGNLYLFNVSKYSTCTSYSVFRSSISFSIKVDVPI